jgi:hypothetical protein
MPRNTRTTDAEALRRTQEQRREADRQRQQTFFQLTGRDILGPPTPPADTVVYYEEEGTFNRDDWNNTPTTNRPAQQDLNETTINDAAQRLLQITREMPAPATPPRFYFTRLTPDPTTWRALYGTPGLTQKEDDSYDMTKMHKLGKWDEPASEIEHRGDYKIIGAPLEKSFSTPSFYKELLQAIHTNTNRVVLSVNKEFPRVPACDYIPRDYFDRFVAAAVTTKQKQISHTPIESCFKEPVENAKEVILGSEAKWGNFGYKTSHGQDTFKETHKTNVSVKNKMDWFRFYESVNEYYAGLKTKQGFAKIEVTVKQAIDYVLMYQYQRMFTRRYTVENFAQGDNQRNAYQALSRFPKYSSRQNPSVYRILKLHFLSLYPQGDKRKQAASITPSNYNSHRSDFVLYLQMLYRLRYKRPMPENRIFYAYSRQSIQWGGDGIVDIGNGGTIANLAPKSWIDNHLFFKCICCDKYQIFENRVIFSPRLTKAEGAELTTFIEAFRTDAIANRVEKRQEAFKKTQAYKDMISAPKEAKAKKPSEPYPLDDVKDTPLISNIKKSLNAYIKSWKGNGTTTKTTDLICELGINHTDKDREEFPRPAAYHDTGHSQSNFNMYSPPFCSMCHNTIFRVHNPTVVRTTLDEDEEATTALERLRRVRSRTYDGLALATPIAPGGGGGSGNIQNYSANPMDSYNGFKLGKGENKTVVFDKALKLDPKTGKTIEAKFQRDQTLYMGVELEVTPSSQVTNLLYEQCGVPKTDTASRYSNSQRLAALIMRQYHTMMQSFIVKSDATTANGFEIVSVPGTHKWHIEEAWKGFFKEDYENEEHARLAPSAWLCGWPNNGKLTRDPMYHYDAIVHCQI